MKTRFYLLVVMIITVIASCSINNDANDSPGIIFNGVQIAVGDTFQIFKDSDIAWYNGTTQELKFNDDFKGIDVIGNSQIMVNAYSGDNFLYAINFMLTTDLQSGVVNSPVIYKDRIEERYILQNGYPYRDVNELEPDDPWRTEREKQWENLVESEGWKLFIQKLKEEGRYRE